MKQVEKIQSIITESDVRKWFRELLDFGVNFNPDDNFEEYVSYETGLPTFSKKEARRLNALMLKARRICAPKGEGRIYDISMQELKKVMKKRRESKA